MSLHDQLQAFVDGELAPADADAFRAHLAGCERCERDLLQAMQLAALGAELGARAADAGAGAPIVPLSSRRRRVVTYVAPALAAAAALAIYLGTRGGKPAVAPAQVASLTLAERRSFEPRLSSPGADRWREYSVARSGGEAPREDIPLHTLAALEDAHDLRTLAGAYLLMHDERQASAALGRAKDSPDTASDRAALALAQKQSEAALAFADAALEAAPNHPQALWNRALALRELGLPLSAADAFDAVAARGEPGWSDEARARAAKLRAEGKASAESWERLETAGRALVDAGTPLPAELVTAHPAACRKYFYDAVRAAPSRERVLALAPLAETLAQRFGEPGLTAVVTHAAAADFVARAPLAEVYRAHATGKLPLDEKSAADFLDRLDRAPARAAVNDLRLGVLLAPGFAQRWPDRLLRAVHESDDPWFAVMPVLTRAMALADRDPNRAEQLLRTASKACRTPYRCLQVAYNLAIVQSVHFNRPVDALAQLQVVRELAGRLGDRQYESLSLLQMGQAASMLGQHERARAFLEEEGRRAGFIRDPAYQCQERAFVSTLLATNEISRLRFPAALEVVRAAPRCEGVKDPQDVLVVADLVRFGVTDQEIAQANHDLEAMRAASGDSPGIVAAAEVVRGRLLAARDPERARPVLEGAIARADAGEGSDVLTRLARAYAYVTLIDLAAARQDFAAAFALFAAEARLTAPEKCALGVTYDDDRVIVAGRGADGAALGTLTRRARPEVDAATVVSPAIIEALRPCAQIEVIARAPLHGQRVLPPDLAWSFVGTGRAAIAAAPPAAAHRLVVANPEPPAELELPRLGDWSDATTSSGLLLSGAAATPSRVLSEMRTATDIEIHAHGLVNTAGADTSVLALSPDADGKFALSAEDVDAAHLDGAPLVILAACETTQSAAYLHETWNLPAAFVTAGARAVLASGAPIPDAEAARFFSAVRGRVDAGVPVARAVRDERVGWLARDANSWTRDVLVFEGLAAQTPKGGTK
jgi:hypothetical protein